MFEGLNRTLIECVRAAQARRSNALAEIRKIHSSKAYTNEYKDRESRRIVEEMRTATRAGKAEGVAAIAANVDKLNADERREAELRAMDTDYLKRLDMKLDTISRLVSKDVSAAGQIHINTPDLSDDTLRTYFSEFADDPIAIATIREKLGARGIKVVPADNTGKRQAHLSKAQAVFELIMNRTCNIGDTGVSDAQDVDSFGKQEEDAFIAYCRGQDNDFALDDEEVFDDAIADAPELKTALESIKWRMSLS